MSKQDHEDLRSLTPAHGTSVRHPMQPFIKGDEIDLPPSQHITYDPAKDPVILIATSPTLPPVAHDPLNMRDHEPNLRALYPKLDDLAAVQAAVWGKLMNDPIERALRRELNDLGGTAATALQDLQKLMHDQHIAQARFNEAYSQIELILAKHPELLKP